MFVVGRYKKELTERSSDKVLSVARVLEEAPVVKVCVRVLVGSEDRTEVIAVA